MFRPVRQEAASGAKSAVSDCILFGAPRAKLLPWNVWAARLRWLRNRGLGDDTGERTQLGFLHGESINNYDSVSLSRCLVS